jgi:hypothetical protein
MPEPYVEPPKTLNRQAAEAAMGQFQTWYGKQLKSPENQKLQGKATTLVNGNTLEIDVPDSDTRDAVIDMIGKNDLIDVKGPAKRGSVVTLGVDDRFRHFNIRISVVPEMFVTDPVQEQAVRTFPILNPLVSLDSLKPGDLIGLTASDGTVVVKNKGVRDDVVVPEITKTAKRLGYDKVEVKIEGDNAVLQISKEADEPLTIRVEIATELTLAKMAVLKPVKDLTRHNDQVIVKDEATLDTTADAIESAAIGLDYDVERSSEEGAIVLRISNDEIDFTIRVEFHPDVKR